MDFDQQPAKLRFENASQSFDISWLNLEALIKGVSALDHHELAINSLDDAEAYLLQYGYDWRVAQDRLELTDTMNEAVDFIERRLCDSSVDWEDMGETRVHCRFPAHWAGGPNGKDAADVRHLLVKASISPDQPDYSEESAWACAVIKVMHTICHINNTLLYRYYDQAKDQIVGSYKAIISQHPDGDTLLGRSKGLQLGISSFEVKDKKSRDSMLLKLLSKREMVAEQLFDLIGVRIVTFTPTDAILALEILRQNKVLIFANIIPGRTRNSLVDFDAYKHCVEPVIDQYQAGELELAATLDRLKHVVCERPMLPAVDKPFNQDNDSSIQGYRALHLTQRQLIRSYTMESFNGEAPISKFFFPYELQIVDVDSYTQNHMGSSAHSQYKLRQLVKARRRVLGSALLGFNVPSHLEDKALPKPNETFQSA